MKKNYKKNFLVKRYVWEVPPPYPPGLPQIQNSIIMKKNASVKPLKGLVAEAGVALAKDVNAPIQDAVVVSTIDYKNNPKPGKDSGWQGYMVRFDDTEAGVPKVVPISAGRLKAIEDEKKISIFEETGEGYVLTNTRMGIQDGEVVFEA